MDEKTAKFGPRYQRTGDGLLVQMQNANIGLARRMLQEEAKKMAEEFKKLWPDAVVRIDE